jgi:hypothetical protein
VAAAASAAATAAAGASAGAGARAAIAESVLFTTLVRGAVESAWSDGALWQGLADAALRTWLARLAQSAATPPAPAPTGAAEGSESSGAKARGFFTNLPPLIRAVTQPSRMRATLQNAIVAHARLSVWSAVSRASIVWQVQEASDIHGSFSAPSLDAPPPLPPLPTLDSIRASPYDAAAHLLFAVDGESRAAGAPVFVAGASLILHSAAGTTAGAAHNDLAALRASGARALAFPAQPVEGADTRS